MSSFSKVFISHAKEDYESAEAVHSFLKANHFEPWLDKKELLPGMDWDNEIKSALRSSDFIVLLLSSTSVSKRGYVQREFRLALDYAKSMLDDDIYIIPLMLRTRQQLQLLISSFISIYQQFCSKREMI